jgi:PIN domain nuclease of toxin-antitoxin system
LSLLLDTHSLLWFWWKDPRLSEDARTAIQDPARRKFVSVATAWEIAIKISLGRLDLGGPFRGFLTEQVSINGFD